MRRGRMKEERFREEGDSEIDFGYVKFDRFIIYLREVMYVSGYIY